MTRGAHAVMLALLAAPRAWGSEYESVVTAEPSSTTASARRLTRQEATALGASDAAAVTEQEVTATTPVSSRGERTIILRGLDQRQITVLLDGAPLTSPFDGQLDLAGIPLAALERVEIVRSGEAPPSPGGGLGGALLLTTRRPGAGPRLELWSEAAASRSVRAGVASAVKAGRLAYSAWGGGERSPGFPLSGSAELRTNSDRSLLHAGAALSWQPARGESFEVHLTGLDGSHGVPPGLVDEAPRFWRWNVWRALLASAGHRHRGRVDVESVLYLRLYENLLDSYDDASYTTQVSARAFDSRFRDAQAGLMVHVGRELSAVPGRIRIGTHAWLEVDGHSERVRGVATVPSALSPHRMLVGARPMVEAGSGVSVAASCDVAGGVPAPLMLAPRVTMHARPDGERWEATLSIARRQRLPTLKERYAGADGYRVPNPELRAETAWVADAAVTWRPGRFLSATASGFATQLDGIIERVVLGPGQDQLQNAARARLLGAELLMQARSATRFSLEAAYAFLHVQMLESPAGWRTLPHRPRHQLRGALVLWPLQRIELATSVRVVGAQSVLDPNRPATFDTLGTFVVWDARLELRLTESLRVHARATNVLDARYQTELGYPDAGRQIWLGVSLQNI